MANTCSCGDGDCQTCCPENREVIYWDTVKGRDGIHIAAQCEVDAFALADARVGWAADTLRKAQAHIKKVLTSGYVAGKLDQPSGVTRLAEAAGLTPGTPGDLERQGTWQRLCSRRSAKSGG